MRYWTISFVFLPAIASAQINFERPGQYPEFRSLSGLPGGGFGVLPDGTASIKGAMALSSPIAYSLGHNGVYLGLADTANDQKLRFNFFHHSATGDIFPNGGNGTGVALAGFTTPYGNVSGTFEVLSGKFNSAYNFEFTPKLDNKIATLGIGVQDARGHGGTGGELFDTSHAGWTSRSLFAVATRPIGDRTYVSVGVGTKRFRTAFGNVSYGITDRTRALVEYDGFNFNYGLAGDFGAMNWLFGRKAHIVTFLGDVDGKYVTWTVGITF